MADRQDIRDLIREKYANEFLAYERLCALAQDLLDQNPDKAVINPERPSTSVVAALFAKAWKTIHAIHLLARKGYGEDAIVLARSLTNLCIDLSYICKEHPDERARQWIAEGKVQRFEMARDLGTPIPDEAEYRTLKAKSGKWLNIKERAKRGGSLAFYLTNYRHGSSYEHSDSWSADSFLQPEGDYAVSRNEPSETGAGEALFMGASALIMIVAAWGQFYGMDIRGFDRAMRPIFDMGFGVGD